MEKRPIVWRFLLIAALTFWALTKWYPPETPITETFASLQVADNKQSDVDVILRTLEEKSADLSEGQELSQGDWEEAIGDYNLSELFADKNLTNGVPQELGLDPQQWTQPADDEVRTLINRAIVARIQKKSQKVKLGLDLRGGTEFVVRVHGKTSEDGAVRPVNPDQLSQAMEIIRRRVDKFGVAEPIIQTSGEDHIVIQIPGLSQADRDQARETISEVAKLEFRLTHAQSSTHVQAANNSGDPATYFADPFNLPLQTEALSYEDEGTDGSVVTVFEVVEKKVALSGKHITSASARRNDLTGTPEIHFTLDSVGANIFSRITETHKVGGGDARQLCIVLDGQLISAPSIQSRIHSRGQITGRFTVEEATRIANSLENPLENEVEIVEEREVDPSLGRDSVNKGRKAALWGLGTVAVFMVFYYLLSGVIANFALALNIVLILGVLCWFDATLTLPGIAGIVLTIGMAVDANVLIFERIREELGAGKSLGGAIKSGYDKAFGTIFDANITTMIASVILIYMGKGPVKGFGVTLTIGILTSMFTALVATRLVMDLLLNAGIIGKDSTKRAMHLRPEAKLPKFDFLKYAKPAFIASWVLIFLGFGYGLSKGKEQMLGVDFEGGYSMTLSSEEFSDKIYNDIESGTYRDVLAQKMGQGIEGSQIQMSFQGEKDGSSQVLRVTFPASGEGNDTYAESMMAALKSTYGDNLKRLQLDKVGGSVSSEIQKSAVIAVVVALFGILIYVAFRYEYSFAVAAVIAILHDVLMTGGWFFLTGRELNAPIVAAALTIIGFSINDTIVIFDRIRENLRMGTRGSFANVMNVALNQTLSRTVITSGTTLLSTGTLYFFGGTVINDFAFTFLVGVITGTYSSIYIACAIVLWWHKGKRPELENHATLDSDPVNVTA